MFLTLQAQKTDLIAELKMSKDITGIKKLKVERAKMENLADKEIYSEFTKQFTASNFVEQVVCIMSNVLVHLPPRIITYCKGDHL